MTSNDAHGLRAFLLENVSSFEELETLLFLAGAPPRAWSCADIAAALNLPDESVQSALEALSKNLVMHEGSGATSTYRFAPGDGLEALVERLQRAYDDERLAIVQAMTTNAMDRVRRAAALRLTHRFRLERTKKP